VWLYIDKIYDCSIDTVHEGSKKHMTIRCEYASDNDLHNISMRLRYANFEITPPDDGSQTIVGVLNITIYFDKIVIVTKWEHGGIGIIVVQRWFK
jgi:hypothetical protein